MYAQRFLKHVKQAVVFASFQISIFGFAASREAIDRAAILEVKPEGFKTLSKVLLKELGKKTKHMEISDQSKNIPFLMDLHFRGLTFLSSWNKLNVLPESSGIKVEVEGENLVLNIKQFEVVNKIIPFLTTTCEDISLVIGHVRPLSVGLQSNLVLHEKRIKINEAELLLSVDSDQYETHGPSKCVNILGIRDVFSEFALSMLLSYSKAVVEKFIHKGFKSVLLHIENEINMITNLTMQVDFDDQWILPETSMTLGMSPKNLEISDQGLLFELSLWVKRNESKALVSDLNSKKLHLLGTIGINPEIVNQVFEAIYEKPGPLFELAADLHPIFESILKKDQFNTIWPDLDEITTSSDMLRLYLQITKGPKVTMNQVNHQLLLNLDDVHLNFQIEQENEWKNYFHIFAGLGLGMTPTVQNNELSINFFSPKPVSVEGYWDEDYTPKDSNFSAGDVSELFTFMSKAAAEKLSPMKKLIPFIHVHDHLFGFHNLRVEEPYLKLDIIQNK